MISGNCLSVNLERYEGLLESELTCAETDLATDRKGFYRPANQDEEVIVKKGEFYLSNGGQRKSSASFYTKEFAVEHLLERSLEPALDDHLARIDALETDQEKSEAFFDFMIADISMGSGHFLVAAVDRIGADSLPISDENPLEGYEPNSIGFGICCQERSGNPWMKPESTNPCFCAARLPVDVFTE